MSIKRSIHVAGKILFFVLGIAWLTLFFAAALVTLPVFTDEVKQWGEKNIAVVILPLWYLLTVASINFRLFSKLYRNSIA